MRRRREGAARAVVPTGAAARADSATVGFVAVGLGSAEWMRASPWPRLDRDNAAVRAASDCWCRRANCLSRARTASDCPSARGVRQDLSALVFLNARRSDARHRAQRAERTATTEESTRELVLWRRRAGSEQLEARVLLGDAWPHRPRPNDLKFRSRREPLSVPPLPAVRSMTRPLIAKVRNRFGLTGNPLKLVLRADKDKSTPPPGRGASRPRRPPHKVGR